MTERLSDYLGPELTNRERLAGIQVLCRGAEAVLTGVLRRLSSYHDLLELELREENQGARLYLGEARQTVTQASAALSQVRGMPVAADERFEAISLPALLQAAAKRVGQVTEPEVRIDVGSGEPDPCCHGDLWLLQQLCLELPSLLHAEAGTALRWEGRRRCLAADAPGLREVGLPPGNYFGIWLSVKGQSPPEGGRWRTLAEQALITGSPALEALLFFCYGVTLLHRGMLLTPATAGPPRSLMLWLPLHENRVGMHGAEAGVGDSALRGSETVLLVDDEGIIWDVVIDMLQSLGYTVILAADGQECVEVYRENPGQIDLVLLDMVMPRMNGHDAFHALRDIDPDVKVLLSSGYVKEDEARHVLEAGALGFLEKPYRMVDLARRIREIFAAE